MKHDKPENRNLILYFLIAFAFSWIFWLPQALISMNLLSTPPFLADFLSSPFNPAAFGPLISAFSLTYITEGKKGVKNLLKRGVNYKIGKIWYIQFSFFSLP